MVELPREEMTTYYAAYCYDRGRRSCRAFVRISGLSARFVCLTPDVQEEMISRALLTV